MTKRKSSASPLDPYLAWGYLGVQAMEMLAASARVIHHRTHRRNTPAQLFTMGSEKIEAAIEASHAVTRHWLSLRTRALNNARRIARR